MQSTSEITLQSVLPLLITSIAFALVGFFLSRDKGRRVWLWTVVTFIPAVNIFFLIFLVGCSNLRLERKLDRLLEQGRIPVVQD